MAPSLESYGRCCEDNSRLIFSIRETCGDVILFIIQNYYSIITLEEEDEKYRMTR